MSSRGAAAAGVQLPFSRDCATLKAADAGPHRRRRSADCEAARGVAHGGGLRRGRRRRRRARGLPRPDRALRRDRARSRPAEDRRPHPDPALARGRARDAGAGADRARQLARKGPGHRRGRRRLRREALQGRGGPRAAAGADPPRERTADARHPVRPHRARYARRAGHAERESREAHEPRVPRALLSDAPPRTRGVAVGAARAHLRPECRPRLEHRGGVHRTPAPEARGRLDRNHAGARVPHGRRGRGPVRSLRGSVLLGAILWTVGLLAVWSIVLTFYSDAFTSIRVVHQHAHMMAVLAIITAVAGFAVVRAGLTPFEEMRRRLGDIQRGADRRLQGRYPREVQPLVNDLNALLAHQEQAVRRALGKAGDLAHGLKTPLAVMSQEAERAASAGHPDLASALAEQIERMRRQIEYHLAHARAAASGATPGARCLVAASAAPLARTLLRLHAERGITIEVRVPPDDEVRGQREDLDEMLGNLLDNACKWARSRVTVTSTTDAPASDATRAGDLRRPSTTEIVVDDDGPGLVASMREAVLQRGVRADEAAPGSGFGLAIVRELAELYGGSIVRDAAPAGGLRARLRLPSAQ